MESLSSTEKVRAQILAGIINYRNIDEYLGKYIKKHSKIQIYKNILLKEGKHLPLKEYNDAMELSKTIQQLEKFKEQQ